MMMRRVALAALVLCALVRGSNSQAGGADETANGTLTVKLVDGKTKKVVPYARVIVRGIRHIGITNEKGIIVFEAIAPGRYEVIADAVTYVPRHLRVRVAEGERKTLNVRLKHRAGWKPIPPESLKVIRSTYE